jgi:hypothetical protein
MPRRRSRLRLGTGLSLTRRDPAVRAGPVGLADLGLADLGPAARDPVDRGDRAVRGLGRDLGDPVDLAGRGRAALAVRPRVDLADIRDRVDLAGPPVLVLRDPVDRAGPVGLADLGLAGLGLAGRVDQGMDRADPAGLADLGLAGRVDQGMDRADPVGLAELDLADPADLAGLDLAGRVDQGMDRADPVGLADLGLAGRVDLGDQGMDPVDRLDRQQRRTRPGVLSTGVAPRWAAPGMCRAASARPATVRRLRRHNTDGAGMAGLRLERRRLGGTDRRPRVAGAVLRLPVVGTPLGTVRRAISQSRSVISARSITTAITRSRCSTRFSVDGASGSSGSGSRCTDTT